MVVSKAIIGAGGHSKRMNGIDKIFVELAGKPVIAHTISAFQESPMISGIILILSKDNLEKGADLVKKYGYTKVEAICEGGETRQQSISNGLKLVGECDIILVHDGARPCVTKEAIELGIREAQQEGVAIAASPVTDTIKQVDSNSHVTRTLDRSQLRSIHTPQAFRADILKKIHENPTIDVTDDAGLAESMGYPVKVYNDSLENIKITTKEDLATAEIILSKRNSGTK